MNFKSISKFNLDKKNLFLLFMVISGPACRFTSKQHILINLFLEISPAPVVFSNSFQFQKNSNTLNIDFYSNETEFIRRHHDRSFHSKLKGPGRYRSMNYRLLNSHGFLRDKTNSLYLHDFFCKFQNIKDSFGIDFEIKKIILGTEKIIYNEISCTNT